MSQEPQEGQELVAQPEEKFDGKADPSKFYLVRFHAQATKNDTVDVELTHNTDTLIIQREKRVVVPGKYLLVCDDARYPVYRQEVGQQRKIVGWVRTYPYDMIALATELEYVTAKREGTRIAKAARESEDKVSV